MQLFKLYKLKDAQCSKSWLERVEVVFIIVRRRCSEPRKMQRAYAN